MSDLHRILVGTSDQQLIALFREFPRFYRYATIMEEGASEAECKKASRPYDGVAELSEQHKTYADILKCSPCSWRHNNVALMGGFQL